MKQKRRRERALTFAVLGAGHGGLAMAAHLGLMGFPTRLWNRSRERVDHVADRRGIDLEGAVEGFGEIELATSDIASAIDGANVVMVAVPASGHLGIAQQCSSSLKANQLVILNPGRTFGAIEFLRVLQRSGGGPLPIVAEAQTFIYVSRHTDFTRARIMQIKNSVPLAAIPAHKTPHVLDVVRRALPQFVAATNVLETSLDNIGAIFHPTLTLLNAARIESTHGDFEYYLDGVTPSTSAILEAADSERVAVGSALGIHLHTAREWLYLAYGSVGDSLFEAIQSTHGYKGVRAPSTLAHRYILEDVPMSMVPMVSVGEMLGVKMPTMRSLVHVASLIHSTDFMSEGRTVDKLGLSGMTVRAIRMLAVRGLIPR